MVPVATSLSVKVIGDTETEGAQLKKKKEKKGRGCAEETQARQKENSQSDELYYGAQWNILSFAGQFLHCVVDNNFFIKLIIVAHGMDISEAVCVKAAIFPFRLPCQCFI